MSYMRGRLYNESKLVQGKKYQNDTLSTKDKIAKETNVGSATIMRDAKFALAVDSMPEYRNEILNGETERTKQEIVEVVENVNHGLQNEVLTFYRLFICGVD